MYAVGLTLLGAAIAGVLPALKITRGLNGRLRQVGTGGGGARFGGVWTALIVAQIGITVAFPVTAYLARRDAVQVRSLELGLPAHEYLSARISMDRDVTPANGADTSTLAFQRRFSETIVELRRRLASESGVASVAFTSLLPGMDHPQYYIEVDGESAAPVDSVAGHRVSAASVSEDYFAVASAPVTVGRGFVDADRSSGSPTVIVNQTFVRQVLGERHAIGRRVRYAVRESGATSRTGLDRPGPWYEIVDNLAMTDGSDPRESGAGIYHPFPPIIPGPVLAVVHVKGDPRSFIPTMRVTALALDPTLRLDRVLPLDELQLDALNAGAFWFRALVSVSGMALLLSLAAIYAVMAFAVSRRTREIGVRVALGSDRRRIITTIFARPLRQMGMGIAVGIVLASILVYLVFEQMTLGEASGIFAYAATMLGICLLACIVPTRRALAIQPTEALRSDG